MPLKPTFFKSSYRSGTDPAPNERAPARDLSLYERAPARDLALYERAPARDLSC